MARLVVLRGQTPFRELELIQFPVRIGRGQQNEVVLEDPLNSVSRHHAEIRFENGRYLLVDAGSENGIWVAGMRESSVAMDPNVVASIGPFRLTVEGGPAASRAEAPAAAAAPVKRDAPAPAAAKADPKKQVAARSGETTKTVKSTQGSSGSGKWIGVAAVVALLVVSAGLLFWMRGRGDQRSPELVQHLAAAQNQMSQNNCADALRDHIVPALAIDPADAEALALKQQAEGCATPPPPPADDPATVAAQHLALAAQLIDNKDCTTALNDHINKVLETDAANAAALELKTRAEACGTTAAATTTTPQRTQPQAPQPGGARTTVKAISPDQGGLDVLPGETEAQYQSRVQSRRAAYDQGVAQLQARNYQAAVTSLDAVRQSVPAGYLELDANLAAARKGLKTQAQQIRTRAADFEKAGNFDNAIREYRRAHDADPDLAVDADIKRVSDAKIKAGEEACEEGRKAFAVSNAEAYRAAYQRAFTLLPQSHACYETARVRSGNSNR